MKKIGDKELQKVCDEGEKYGVGRIIKDMRTTDLNRSFPKIIPPTVS